MQRRRLLGSVGTLAAVGLAGCSETVDDQLDDFGSDDSHEGNSRDDRRGSSDERDDEDEAGPESAVRAYVQAVRDGNADTQERLLHEDLDTESTSSEPVDVEIRTVDRRAAEEIEGYDGPGDVIADRRIEGVDDAEIALVFLTVEHAEEGFGDAWFVTVQSGDDWRVRDSFSPDATGEESSQVATDRIEVMYAVGTVGSDDTLSAARIVVAAAPGSDEIDLRQTSVEVTSASDHRGLTHGFSSEDGLDPDELPSGEFVTVPINAEDSSTLSASDDRIEIRFPVEALGPGDHAVVTITTEAGVTTETELSVPDSLPAPGEQVRL